MEVFFGSTPTYSGNYKANLETFPDQYIPDTPKAILLVELGIALSLRDQAGAFMDLG